METRTHRPDLHVVQQSRRDKLRFQNNIPSSSSSSYLGDYSDNSEHWSLHNKQQGPNMDLAQLPSCPRYGNVSYDPSVLSSEMLNFGSDSQSLALHNKTDGVIVNQESSISPRDKRVVMNGVNNAPFSTLSNRFGDCSAWKSVGDWNNVASYSNNDNIVVNPMAVGETSSSLIPNVKPSYSSSFVPGQYSSWLDNSRSELHLLPNYGDRNSGVLCDNNGDSDLVNRAVEGIHHEWHSEFERGSRNEALSLSLSSVSPSKSQFGPVGDQHNNNSVSGDFNGVPGLRPLRSDYLCSSSSKNWSKVLENTTLAHLNVVPFGPFTGYATILKSSRFLKPAQQLLNELCDFSGHSALTVSELTKKVLDEVILSNDAFDDNGATTLFGSNSSGLCSSNTESYPRPEFHQTRVKLLFMQDEICRRYKQYHQQMHMVVSSFESVAGLSAATPYILLALKTVARNFYSIKTAISDQLRNIRKTLGQELLSRAGGSKGDNRVGSGLKLVDHPTLEKPRALGGFLDPQPHVWRPQRGLPERAVGVLRAWLFDHFLHPYPTDADKHMLATQTGLTRNQVSNWFINARVRVWKPMVEEIHMLETKAMTERGGPGKPEVTIATEGLITQPNHTQHFNNFAFPNDSQYSNRLSMRGIPGVQAECCSGIGSSPYIGERSHPGASWGPQEKQQSGINCHVPPVGMDGPMMGFVPYHHPNSLEIGGLGSVSLTLGLRQSAEGAQQHEPQLRQQLGGQMMHDYFG